MAYPSHGVAAGRAVLQPVAWIRRWKILLTGWSLVRIRPGEPNKNTNLAEVFPRRPAPQKPSRATNGTTFYKIVGQQYSSTPLAAPRSSRDAAPCLLYPRKMG